MIVTMKVLEDGRLKQTHRDNNQTNHVTITRRYCIEHIFAVDKEKV